MTGPLIEVPHTERRALGSRASHFWHRPWTEKREVLSWYLARPWNKIFAVVPSIKRMDEGFLWLAWNDVIRGAVLQGSFEMPERNFVERFLRPGMTVVDIGAYSGLYTLTASLKVGRQGRVIAFEPSPFQRRRLQWNVWLNHCTNVRIESAAVGNKVGEETLFSVRGKSAGYSSLRRPSVADTVQPITVSVTTLDDYAKEHSLESADFMKIDVEGGEMDVFKGAVDFLRKQVRPVILCELEDARTAAWDYKAKDIAVFVERFGFRWFRPLPEGKLAPFKGNHLQLERNFVAVPEERLSALKEIVDEAACS